MKQIEPPRWGGLLRSFMATADVVIQICCACCAKVFVLCRSCYRGQVYCDDACRKNGTRRRQRLARSRHQRTPEGRRDHRDRMRALRSRRRSPVTDGASQPPVDCAGQGAAVAPVAVGPAVPPPLCCAVCGRTGTYVGAFGRTGRRQRARPQAKRNPHRSWQPAIPWRISLA